MGKAEHRKNSPFALVLAFVSLFILFNFSWSSSFNLFWYGGWGWASIKVDYCPNGDFSPSYYDNSCGKRDETSWGNNVVPDVKDSKGNIPVAEVKKYITKGNYKATRITSKTESLTLNGDGTIVIPENTLVAGRLTWDGKIQAPTILQNTNTKKRGSVLVKAGWNSPLIFTKPVTVTIPVTIANGKKVKIYYSSNGKNWSTLARTTVKDGKVTFTTKVLGYFLVTPVN